MKDTPRKYRAIRCTAAADRLCAISSRVLPRTYALCMYWQDSARCAARAAMRITARHRRSPAAGTCNSLLLSLWRACSSCIALSIYCVLAHLSSFAALHTRTHAQKSSMAAKKNARKRRAPPLPTTAAPSTTLPPTHCPTALHCPPPSRPHCLPLPPHPKPCQRKVKKRAEDEESSAGVNVIGGDGINV